MRTALVGTLVVYLLPVLLTAIDRFVVDYQIGPIVLYYSVAAFLCSIPLFGRLLKGHLKEAFAVVATVLISVVSAVLVLNWFMLLTAIFEVKDYDPM